ncbi:class I SAM-dependent methyltransferase [Longimicrobium sp.]|uniref:class I SAM-dependent methyltransferase n=1 Tax=Longimicrobium sp. TaxID=2029185 RepID=UPI002E3109E9|nr:class I SAM-dependent methyltransferase [Longimicrobium sp.]HEX6039425.1 class I SAM-dependent methyltransferase [Longimicrobium sp.]
MASNSEAAKWIGDVLADERPLRQLDDGLFSVLPEGTAGHAYDGRARAYDRMIGSRLYNRIAWGSSPADYRRFARRAVESASGGWFLDAGCGTLLLTADAYLAAPTRPIVVLDQSLGMLRRARERLLGGGKRLPPQVVLLQADLLDLPFRPGAFRTVMSMGMLHLFADAGPLAASLESLLLPDGALFLTSLVENGRLGDRYLRFLHRQGETAEPRAAAALEAVLRGALRRPLSYSVNGNMAYAVAE